MNIPDAERSVFREGDVDLSVELLIEKQGEARPSPAKCYTTARTKRMAP
jgi:hypothetical protein